MKLLEMKPSAAQGKVLLKFEDGSKLRVPYFLAADHGLHGDMELTDEALAQLREAAGKQSAKERAVRILSMTNTTRQGLRRSLRAKGESAEDTDAALVWLEELNLLDDRAAAEAMVRSAVGKGYGSRRIREILRNKGVEQPLCEELIAALPPMEDAVDRILRQKLKSVPPEEKEIRHAVDALLRYGHEWQDIRAGLTRFRAEIDGEEL